MNYCGVHGRRRLPYQLGLMVGFFPAATVSSSVSVSRPSFLFMHNKPHSLVFLKFETMGKKRKRKQGRISFFACLLACLLRFPKDRFVGIR